MHTFADHPAARSFRVVGKRNPWWLLGVVAVVAVVVGGLGGWAITNATKATPTPAAEPVARQVATLLVTATAQEVAFHSAKGETAKQALFDNVRATENRLAALYAKDAVATDVPSGVQATGRADIQGGWSYVISRDGAWRVDQVLADDHWATVVVTRTRDSKGHKVSAPWVMLLNVRHGLIASHFDIYDAQTWPW